MRRIGAIFIAVCMVLIAASIGAVLYLGFKIDASTSAIIALAALTGMALFNAVSGRLRDRGDLGDQIADLSRGTADLARQVAEISRRLNAMEIKVASPVNRARGAADPLAAEIGELGSLVRQIAETVAGHAAALQKQGALAGRLTASAPKPEPIRPVGSAMALGENDPLVERFRGLSRESVADLISKTVEANRVDLYLQPIVTLPQRKVRYYEAMSRLRTEDGDIISAVDFVDVAERVGMMPKIDNLAVFRCVQVVRRLLLKSRDVGLFCNLSAATLNDAVMFQQLLDFMDANRVLAASLMFEFKQDSYRKFGPIEHECLASLAERGFRFSMDHVTDLHMSPNELAERSFRFLKVPAKLLLNKVAGVHSDIDPEDLADLLARSGIDLIAERIENEMTVVDILDYDVRFGQGFLFSPPRPVRTEALGTATESAKPGLDDSPGALLAAS
ncbi:MAG TPA: EAL domain-containing protein [Pseudolabrys sp.]|jgi:cyclic-di-GMP phosphodiesterase TipF (flagellum assembly factor)